jgi:hypothetical protein
MINQRLSPEQGEELIKLTPRLVKLIIKGIKFSKGGLNKEERQELGQDLLLLAYDVLGDIVD